LGGAWAPRLGRADAKDVDVDHVAEHGLHALVVIGPAQVEDRLGECEHLAEGPPASNAGLDASAVRPNARRMRGG